MLHLIGIFARISEAKFREILKYFCLDIEAIKICKNIRILIAKECEKISKLNDEPSIVESYFCFITLATASSVMLKRNDCVYMQMVKNYATLSILSSFAELESSTIYSDTWKAYDELVYFGVKAHYRVKHSKNEFALGRNHINEIEKCLEVMSNID